MLRLRWGAAALEHFGISLNSLGSKEGPVQRSESQERKEIASAIPLADRAQFQRQALKQQLFKQSSTLLASASASPCNLGSQAIGCF